MTEVFRIPRRLIEDRSVDSFSEANWSVEELLPRLRFSGDSGLGGGKDERLPDVRYARKSGVIGGVRGARELERTRSSRGAECLLL